MKLSLHGLRTSLNTIPGDCLLPCPAEEINVIQLGGQRVGQKKVLGISPHDTLGLGECLDRLLSASCIYDDTATSANCLSTGWIVALDGAVVDIHFFDFGVNVRKVGEPVVSGNNDLPSVVCHSISRFP